jgi:flagellin
MTRINSNVPASIAQANLARSQGALQVALQRLSTGLRINVGKDDPAGLIASEVLRSDIVSIERAIANSERANQVIATADSALGQVSSLLNDIRGLVSEAANTGALSQEQIEANQLQVDSSLEAIDRIARTTSFQGRKLLDGSLDFTTSSTGSANTFATASIGVSSDTLANAELSTGTANTNFVLTAKNVGTDYNNYTIDITTGGAAGSVAVGLSGTNIQITLTGSVTAAAVISAINSHAVVGQIFSASNATGHDGSGLISADTTAAATTSAGAYGNIISITALTAGTGPNSYTISLSDAGGGASTVALSGSNLEIAVSTGAKANEIRDLIGATGLFSATVSGSGLGDIDTGTATSAFTGGVLGSANLTDLRIDQANFGTADSISVQVQIDTQAEQGRLVYSGGALSSSLVLEVGGRSGFETFNFGSGNTLAQIRDAINLVSDATGISASISGSSDLVFNSTEYGADAFVSVRALSGSFDTYDAGGAETDRDAGSDVALRVNGIEAQGKGLVATINTATLDLSFRVNSELTAGSTVNFTITGGGANFQLGPDVVSNQQARLGIQGVNTATLGGTAGTLYELRTGGAKSLETDVTGAAAVVDQVISKVSSLRGRLGAFQKTTLETNIYTLTDTLQALTDAQSSIRDADFAKETASLTRAQILVQSGTTVLTIANQNPQQVLALLR